MGFDPGATILKAATAVKPYHADWRRYLGAAVIVSSEWHVTCDEETTPDLTIDADSVLSGSQITQAWLSGGTVGRKYRVTNQITTNETPPRTDNRWFTIYAVHTEFPVTP